MNNKKIHEPYNLPTLDDFFERTHGSYMGRVERIDINRIENFKNHPFKVKDDEQMENLVESIIENGLSKEECKMLSKIIILNYKLQEIEENEIYFKGGMDAYFYFRKLGIMK